MLSSDFMRDYSKCIVVVMVRFSHLSFEDIFAPPKAYLDAALARQIALSLLINELGYPRRRVCVEMERSRGVIAAGMSTVSARIKGSVAFSSTYKSMVSDLAKITSNKEVA